MWQGLASSGSATVTPFGRSVPHGESLLFADLTSLWKVVERGGSGSRGIGAEFYLRPPCPRLFLLNCTGRVMLLSDLSLVTPLVFYKVCLFLFYRGEAPSDPLQWQGLGQDGALAGE